MGYLKVILFLFTIATTTACQQEEVIHPEIKFTTSEKYVIENEEGENIDPNGN